MNRLTKYFTQRYPIEENVWKIIIPISLFVGLFMLIFQPFGLDGLQSSNKYLILSGYGLVTFLVLIVNLLLIPSVLPALFREENWTVLKEIFFLLWILFTVGLANLLYSSWTMGFPLSFTNILAFQTYTLAVGILPITTIILVKQHYLKRKNEVNAEILSHSINERHASLSSGQIVLFSSDNVRENLELVADHILYIKAEGNYITIAYLKNGKIARTLFRNTMKYAADLLASNPSFYQSHRSWIVNLNRISGISGNSQGLRLRLESFDEEIPVARNNTAIFKKIMMESRA
jgi:hypothetical protein